MELAQEDVNERQRLYEQMAGIERHAPDDKIAKDGDSGPSGIVAVEEELP